MSIKFKFALVTCLLCTNTLAASLCEIDHVENASGGVKVIFNKDSNINIRGIKHPNSQTIESLKAGATLILNEGDESGIYLGPHDICVLKAVKKENKLGIMANSNNHIPGMTPVERSEFIVPIK